MLEGINRRQEMRQLRSDERELARISQRGRDARAQGLPCSAPIGYDVSCTIDLAGAWAAGWEDADRELEGNEVPGRWPERGVDGAGEGPPHLIPREPRGALHTLPGGAGEWSADAFVISSSRPPRRVSDVSRPGR